MLYSICVYVRLYMCTCLCTIDVMCTCMLVCPAVIIETENCCYTVSSVLLRLAYLFRQLLLIVLL